MDRADGDRGLPGSPGSESPSPDEVFSVLADRRRRVIVASLLAGDNSVPVDSLVADVMVTTDVSPDEASETRSQIAMKLQHVHLPKLETADLVEWDRDHEVVAPTDHLAALESLVDTVSLDRFYR